MEGKEIYKGMSGTPWFIEGTASHTSGLSKDEIIQAVEKELNVSYDKMQLRTRVREIVTARQMCMYLIKSIYPIYTFKQLATMFGHGTDHSSVIKGITAIKNLIDSDYYWKTIYGDILMSLKIARKETFTILQEDYNIDINRKRDKIIMNQDGSIITISFDNLRLLYLSTL